MLGDERNSRALSYTARDVTRRKWHVATSTDDSEREMPQQLDTQAGKT